MSSPATTKATTDIAKVSSPAGEPPAEPPTGIAALVAKVMAWFPVRVWMRFTTRNGQTLAAGASYQALFAMFAGVYVAFAGVGVWLGGNADAIDTLIDVINRSLPGVIGPEGSGAVVTSDAVHQIASQSITTLGVTGIISLIAVLWTAVGWIGSIRVTVRDIFGLPAETGNIIWLQARDLIAAFVFAVLLLVGAVLGWAGTAALSWLFDLFGWEHGFWLQVLGSAIAVITMLLVDVATLLMLFRFLTGTALRTRDVLPGAIVGAVAITVLQLAFGFLIGKTPANPLLVTFAVLIGLLAWIRFVMTAILVAAAWVAESADDNDIALLEEDDLTRRQQEADLLIDAAVIDLHRRQADLADAGFFSRGRARRDVAHAENVLAQRHRERDALVSAKKK